MRKEGDLSRGGRQDDARPDGSGLVGDCPGMPLIFYSWSVPGVFLAISSWERLLFNNLTTLQQPSQD